MTRGLALLSGRVTGSSGLRPVASVELDPGIGEVVNHDLADQLRGKHHEQDHGDDGDHDNPSSGQVAEIPWLKPEKGDKMAEIAPLLSLSRPFDGAGGAAG